MKTLAELIAEFRSGALPLPALLQTLDGRGLPPASVLPAELAALDAAVADTTLDAETARIIALRLRGKPASADDSDVTQPVRQPPADDATVVRPLAAAAVPAATAPLPPADDATVVRPLTAVPPPAPFDDATVVRPLAAAAAAVDDATRVLPRTPVTPARPALTDVDVTRVAPKSPPLVSPPPIDTAARTQTGNAPTSTQSGTLSGTSSSSSWQRVADAEGGDSVTVGSLLKGRFLLEKEIGRGGMGVVYLARDERKVEARDRDPYVAVKVLNDEFRRHPDSLIALQRESRRSQQLAHDNIVRVFDFDKDGTIVFMTMEYIDGSDLKGLIREKAANGLSLKEARPLIEGMCRGLARAHADGVVHSDFKPGNVMVTRKGIPKVFDFGIARAGKMGDAVGETTVFDAGTLGALTPAYASLEMIEGKEPQNTDDIYALGCVAFELLTGKHPFDKLSAEVARNKGRKPPLVPGLTKRQYKALCAAVAFTREQRLANAMDLVEGLRDLSLRERAMPYLMAGIPATVVVVGGAIGFLNYRENQRIDSVGSRFEISSVDHYADETAAQLALDELDAATRNQLVLSRGELIERFLVTRVDGYWNPEKNRYDYSGAQRVFALRDRLKLYSPTLDSQRATVERSRADLLNTLDSTLTAQIDADAIFETAGDNAVATLARIKAIDPGSGLLKNARLELKYDAAIGQSLDAGRLDEARQRLALAQRYFSDSPRIVSRAQQVGELSAALAVQQQKEQEAGRAEAERDQAIAALAALVAAPADTADWRGRAAEAYRTAAAKVGDDASAGAKLEAEAKRLRSALEAQVKGTADLGSAIDIAGFGLDLFPGDPALAKARQSLLDKQNKLAQDAQTKTQRIDKSRSRIADLLAKPLGSAVWLQDLRTALNEARSQIGADSADYAQLRRNVNAGIQTLARERIAAGQLDDAERLARSGQQIDATDAGFAAVIAEVAEARNSARSKLAEAQTQKLAEARRSLAALAAKPALTVDWQRSVATAVEQLKGDSSPETRQLVDGVGDSLAAEIARLTTPQQVPQAKIGLDFGLKLLPKSAKLLEQRARVDLLQRDNQAKVDQENAEAEVKSRIESVKSAAAANDVQKARESLARIRSLQPDNAFAKGEGQQLLGDAYLRLAAEAFQRKNWQVAADLVGQAQKTVGDRPEFKAQKARYELVAAIFKAGVQPLDAGRLDALKKQLDDTRKLDPAAFGKLESDLVAAGQLAEKTLAARLDKLKPGTAPAPVAAAPALPAPAAPSTPAPTPSAATPAPAPAAPVVAAPPVIVSSAPFVASGPDPCNSPAMIGTGKACFDALSSARRGPRLAIVPGLNGGLGYGLTRTEVTVANFNEYCIATNSCAPKPIADDEAANLPITGVSLAQANAYAGWLSKVSGGYVYRLPTDAEWIHAAKAGFDFKQAANSNCAGGTGAPASPKGRDANPWGLININGNVWEWVVSGGKTQVRGGSYLDDPADCTVDAKRDDDGRAKNEVGFRLLRELR